MALVVATPLMTSNNTPSGVCNSGGQGTLLFGADHFHAFDRNTLSTFWNRGIQDSTPWVDKWIEFDFGAGKTIEAYRFYCALNEGAKDFTLQGWNGSSWVDKDSRTGVNATGYSSTFTVSSPASYTKYRILCTAGNFTLWPSYVSFAEVEFFEEATLVEVPAADFSFTPEPAVGIIGQYGHVPAAAFDFTPQPATIAIQPLPITVPAAEFPFVPGVSAFSIEPNAEIPSSIIYRLTLTGAADATTDVELPLSSFQSRFRNGAKTYLSAVIPNGDAWAGEVIARPQGSLVLERGVRYKDGQEQLVRLMAVAVDDVADSGGGRNRTLTLSGHQQIDNTAPKSVTLQGIRTRVQSGNGKRFRANLDLNLRPGDTAIVGLESIVVDLITYIVNVTSSEIMEVSD